MTIETLVEEYLNPNTTPQQKEQILSNLTSDQMDGFFKMLRKNASAEPPDDDMENFSTVNDTYPGMN